MIGDQPRLGERRDHHLPTETTIDGRATTEVRRTDLGIGIPNVPSVADVNDEVQRAVVFVATST